jgi:RHS repeat-associated protein
VNASVTGSISINRIASYDLASDRTTENSAALRSYTYDNAGNIITDLRPGAESFTYAYNNRNRMSSVTRNGVAYASYVYNAMEQLASRNTSAPGGPIGTVHYIYDTDGHLIAEADAATGATMREYLWLPSNNNQNNTLAEDMTAANDNAPVDLPLAVVNVSATPVVYQVHTDHLGRPIRMTDAAKATIWQATWKPWGEVQSITGAVAQNLRFPGQYFQLETGLAYNWHRTYDPVTGRYTQPDPLRFVDGPSVYQYAGNSPYVFTDLLGLAKCTYSLTKRILVCVTNNGNGAASAGPDGVFSGGGLLGQDKPECANNPSCTGERFEGPVPPGTYPLIPSDKFGGSYWLEDGWWARQICKLKLGRCGFFLHQGTLSYGCVTVLKGNNLPNTNRFSPVKRLIDQDSGPHSITVVE